MAVTYRANRKRWGFRTSLPGRKQAWHFRWLTKEVAEEAYEAYQRIARLPATTIFKAASDYLVDCRAKRSRSRFEGIRYNLGKWVIPFWGESFDIRSITPESVEAFVSLHLQRVKPITVWHYVKDLRALLNWCIRKKLLNANPVSQADLSSLKHRKAPKPPLDRKAVERGLSVLIGREKLYAHLLAYMGLRRDEGNHVQAKDFTDLGDEGLWLTVKGTKTQGSHRVLPVPPILHDEIRAELTATQPAGDQEIYIGSPRGKYVYDRRKVFKRLSRAAGVHISPKDLRDYFASIMDDPVTAQQMLGHTSLRTTAIYVRQVQQRMLQSVAKIAPLGEPALAANSGSPLSAKPPEADAEPLEIAAEDSGNGTP